MAKTTAKDLTEKMLARGIAPEAIHMVRKEMERWADGFTHPAENVEDTVDELRMNPLIPKDVPIHGLIFHPRTGEIEVIVNGLSLIHIFKDDDVNAFVEKAKDADGFIFATPVYYAHPSGRILSFLDRVFFSAESVKQMCIRDR